MVGVSIDFLENVIIFEVIKMYIYIIINIIIKQIFINLSNNNTGNCKRVIINK